MPYPSMDIEVKNGVQPLRMTVLLNYTTKQSQYTMKNTTYLIYLMVLLVVAVSCSDNAVRPDSKQDEQVSEEFSSMEDGLITLESGAVVKKVGDTFYWQGDIMLSEIQLETLAKHGDIITEGPEEKD